MAAFALISWPFVSLVFFAFLGPSRGLIWSVTAGYLFLPENYGFDVPGLPPLDKFSMIALAAVTCAGLFRHRAGASGKEVERADPLFRWTMLLVFALLLISPVPTYLDNKDEILAGGRMLPASVPQDIVSEILKYIILFTPFLLARNLLVRTEHHVELLIAIVAGGIVYTFLALFEMRMSPQLNNWIYGYFPHSWLQHLRGGGYRPIVFLNHGLWVGFFLLTAIFAAIGLARDGSRMPRAAALIMAIWIFLVLALSHNLGALMLFILLLPAALLSGVRTQARLATIVALLFLAYPVIKQVTQDQLEQLRQSVETIAPDRADSLGTRLDNETLLLERANLKPVFGWGGWGRSKIYNERGREISIVDGLWIIHFGKFGWVGYLSYFGVLVLPILFLRRAVRRKPIPPAIGALAVIATANFIYMVPNATLTPVSLLVFGTLAAFVQFDSKKDEVGASGEPVPADRRTRYSRFTPNHAVRYRRS